MKNLLVDALRQASGRDEKPAPEEPVVDRPPAPGPEEEVAQVVERSDDKDLQLVDSTVLPASMAPIPDRPLSEAVEDNTANEQDADSDLTVLVPALSLSDVSEAERLPRPGKSKAWSLRKSGKAVDCDILVVLGRWSPALCLVALSAAAGTVTLYQNMTAKNLNFELATIPGQAGEDAGEQNGSVAWLKLADTGVDTDRQVEEPRRLQSDRVTETAAVRNSPDRVRGIPAGTGASGTHKPHSVPASVADPAFPDVKAAYEAYTNGRLELAEQHYRNALAKDANHAHALRGLAAVLQRTGRVDDSLQLYEQLLQIDPTDTSAAGALIAHTETGSADKKRTALKVLIQRHPEAASLHFAMGILMVAEERWADAHIAFLETTRLAPDNADYNYNAAVSAQRLGQVGRARSFYHAALRASGGEFVVDRQTISTQLEQLSTTDGDSL